MSLTFQAIIMFSWYLIKGDYKNCFNKMPAVVNSQALADD
ncbi:hypothetical protein SAMN04488511_101398 [Pedobacter suwonensis]|uniref:Uncharacterized protein n=1 Tax=Pedobacter suwonensis TaxID=332999 RepID=A0A1I0SIH5_9SPHI|nr:hypothetical protein SAMN04488511_101398 [Pedobacter suwonensis]